LLPGFVLARHAPDFWQQLFRVLEYQVQPWRYLASPMAFTVSAARCATWLDFLLIPAYVSLIATIIVHARHHLHYSPRNHWARRCDRWLSAWPLIGLAAVDIAENVLVLKALGMQPTANGIWLTWVTLLKLACLGVLLVYLTVISWMSVAARNNARRSS
jgi:hypothetical protein